MCQCPTTGLYHFYLSKINREVEKVSCVNALQRAYIISTRLKKEAQLW